MANAEALRASIREAVAMSQGRLTFKKLAATARIDNSHLSNFINGHRGLSASTAERIESALAALTAGSGEAAGDRTRYLDFVEGLGTVDFRFLAPEAPSKSLTNVNVSDFFVEPTFRDLSAQQKDPASDKDRYKTEPAVLRLDEIEALASDPSHRVIHIFGAVGSGKTMLVRHRVCELARRAKAGTGPRLPILYPLSALNDYLEGGPREGLLDLIERWYGEHDLTVGKLFAAALAKGGAYVFLDGLDEIPTPEKFERAVKLIDDFSRRHQGNVVLVTQRGTEPFGAFAVLQDSLPVRCLDFDAAQQKALVLHWEGLFMRAKEINAHPFDRHHRQFLTYLHTNPLARNPFLLTLMTIMYFRGRLPAVEASVDLFRLFENYFQLCFGDWSRRRSLDGHLVPSPDRSIPLRVDLLRRLAWDTMVDGCLLRSAAAPAAVQDSLSHLYLSYNYPTGSAIGPYERDRAAEWAARVQRYLKDTGLLQGSLRHPRMIQFGFQEELVRNWFLGTGMVQDAKRFQEFFTKCISQPTMLEWQAPVAFAMVAMEPAGKVEELNQVVARALDERPFAARLMATGLTGDALYNVLPLGLMLCLEALQSGALTPGLHKKIVAALRAFYEVTNYAVVTKALHSTACRLIAETQERELPPGWEKIPLTEGELERELQLRQSDDEVPWVEWIDRTWRYQRLTACIEVLLRAAEERYDRGRLSPKMFGKVLRRVIFGLRLVDPDEWPSALDVLGAIRKREDLKRKLQEAHSFEVVSSMAASNRTAIERQMGKRNAGTAENRSACAQEREIYVDPAAQAWDLSECLARLAPRPWNEIRCNARYLKTYPADELRPIILDRDRTPKDRAVAIALLAAELRSLLPEKTLDERWDDMAALLRVANNVNLAQGGEDCQFLIVEGCQVYDIAAWAVRSLFVSGEPAPGTEAEAGTRQIPEPIDVGLPILDEDEESGHRRKVSA
jgi:hypothetical protein